MKALPILIFLLLALPALLVLSLQAQEAAKAETKSEIQLRAEAMMERARHLSDIRESSAQGFRLKATFSFVGKDLETLRGTYTEIWVGDSQWRRETVIGGMRRVEVGGARRRWVLDSDKDFPATAAGLPDVMNIFPSRAFIFDFESVTESADTTAGSECAVTRADSQQLKYAFCFDKKSGALLNRASPEVRPRNTVNVSCLYAIFRRFGDFWVPREIACFEDKHRLMDAKIEELSAERSPDPLLFTPPRGAIELGRCPGRTVPAERMFNPEPGYPTGLHGDNSAVGLTFIVNTHGKPENITVSQTGGKLFDEKAVETVEQWRYKPGACEGEAIPMEVRVVVVFNPQGMVVSPHR